MPLRETLLNLAITAVLVLIVVLAGILLRESRPGPVAPPPVHVATNVPKQQREVVREASDRFEVYPRAELIPSRANEADTLRVRIRGEEYVFVLYFVDALEASMNHPQTLADQGRYFGNASDQTVIEFGAEAAAYVTELLSTRPFRVLTRWERVSNTVRYYAIITVEIEPGIPVYLADLLVKKGYARLSVAGIPTELPDNIRNIQTYTAELESLAKKARDSKAGIWSKVLP